MSDNQNGGPGDKYVPPYGIAAIALYLIALAILVFVVIGTQWPSCVLPTLDANRNTNAETNANAATNTNTAVNANDAGAANANTNAAANANAATNANAAAGTDAAANRNTAANTNAAAQESAGRGAAGSAAAPKPDIDSVEPASGSILGNTSVTIKGKGFVEGDVIKFDQAPAKVTRLSSESISARTPSHEEGVVDVTVVRNNVVEDILPSKYEYTCPAPTGSNLFMLIVFAGALGGIIHAGRSLYWYVGHRDFKMSWMLMYVFLPFGGAAMALVFYLIIIAGFLPTTPGRNVSFFVVAVAALVGMFSQQAALKLTDIANAFFTKPGQGSDAKPQKSLPVSAGGGATADEKKAQVEPPSGPAAGETPVSIKGTGFTDVESVTFGKTAALGFVFNAATSSIDGKAPASPNGEKGPVDVIVKNKAGETAKGTYTYT
jgi:hypothetical protein